MLHNQYDDLERAAVLDNDDEPTEGNAMHRSAARMRRLPGYFVRIPESWFTTDPRTCPFGQRGRLFLLLLHLSRWGQRPVTLTSAIAEQIGLSRRERWRQLQRLEAGGWVRIERNGRKAAVVCPIVIAG